MKRSFHFRILIIIAGAGWVGACASPATESDDCVDPSRINKDAVCTMIYAPVCGCNGQTYSNECVAANAGVKRFEKGECK